MTQTIQKTTRVETLNVDLSGIRLAHGYTFRVLQDRHRNALFELVDHLGTAYMAFLYRACQPPTLDLLRDTFSTCWYPSNRFPLSRQEAIDSVPLETADNLPDLDMWEAHSSMGEDAFWAKPDLLMEIQPMGSGSSTEIMCRGQRSFAYLRNYELDPSDETVTSQALELRRVLHTKNQIKVQTRMSGITASWYIPARSVV